MLKAMLLTFWYIIFLDKSSLKYFGKNLVPSNPKANTKAPWSPFRTFAKAIGIAKLAKFTNRFANKFIISLVILSEKYFLPLFLIAVINVVL